jgi:hypothetical protein
LGRYAADKKSIYSYTISHDLPGKMIAEAKAGLGRGMIQ